MSACFVDLDAQAAMAGFEGFRPDAFLVNPH